MKKALVLANNGAAIVFFPVAIRQATSQPYDIQTIRTSYPEQTIQNYTNDRPIEVVTAYYPPDIEALIQGVRQNEYTQHAKVLIVTGNPECHERCTNDEQVYFTHQQTMLSMIEDVLE